MGKGSRNYSQLTIKRLFSLSGNQCAFPGCTTTFTSPESDANLSNICHISGAEKGGERYDSNMTDKERASYDNLILLCANHHIVTNDVLKHTIASLKLMKQNHEKDILKKNWNNYYFKQISIFISSRY